MRRRNRARARRWRPLQAGRCVRWDAQSVNLALAVTLVAAMVAGPSPLGGQPMVLAADNSTEALTICDQADRLAGEERTRFLERGLELAEDAVTADRFDAKAHFAVFCNLGKKMQGGGPGLRQALVIGRLKRE